MGELSATRQALEKAPVAPGTMATLRALTDPEKRLPIPRDELSRVVTELQPAEQFELDFMDFLICFARCGAAAGPSSVTSDHLFPNQESEATSELLTQVANLLAIGQVPHTILEAIRIGRLTALQKPDGSVRGLVVGDIIRRLVARTIAKQISEKVEVATAPFHYALINTARCECVVHVLQTLTDLDPEATIMSIDGVGAYGLISRNAMLERLLRMEGGDKITPFVRFFYGNRYLWEDVMGMRTCRLALDRFSARRTPPLLRTPLSTLFRSAGGLGLASAVRVRRRTLVKLGRLPSHGQTAAPGNRRAHAGGVGSRWPFCLLPFGQAEEASNSRRWFGDPHWQEMADSLLHRERDPEPSQPKAGWQQRAALCHTTRALMRSQHGPLASAPLTALSTSKATRLKACLAITLQRAPWLGCWGEGAFLWRWPLPKCAVWQEPASPQKINNLDDVWRSWQMGSLCGRARSSP